MFDRIDVVVARLAGENVFGEGEAAGVYYRGETEASLLADLAQAARAVADGLDREALQRLMPAGGARNALDCAFWAVEARLARVPAWKLAGLSELRPLLTTFTIGADAPDECGARAAHWVGRGALALKLKLCGDGLDLDRVAAVRAASPDLWLGVDANRGWSLDLLKHLAPRLVELNVALIEQPLPLGEDESLAGFNCPIPLAADESFQDRSDIARLARFYSVLNIKLDKTGGLTEALACVELGRQLGLKMMVGNMGGTSLAMAPAFIVGQFCEVVDLDGPIYFAEDRAPATQYVDGRLLAPSGWDA